jgi:hypothetical protein
LTVEPFLTTRKTPLGFSISVGKRGGGSGVCRYINIRAKSRSFGGGFGRFVFSDAFSKKRVRFDFYLIKEAIR